MSLGAIFLIREPMLRGIAFAGGCLSVLVAALVLFTHQWSGDESRAVLLVPFVFGALSIGVATVLRGGRPSCRGHLSFSRLPCLGLGRLLVFMCHRFAQ